MTSKPSRRSRSTVAVTFIVCEPAIRVVRSARRIEWFSGSNTPQTRRFSRRRVLNQVRHQTVDLSAEREDLFDQPRADEGVLFRGHHENRFDVPVQPLIHERHLEFELEVGHRAKSAHNYLSVPAGHVVDKQARRRYPPRRWIGP